MKKVLQTKNLKEIIGFCESNKIDIKDVTIESEIVMDLSTCKEKVKLYINY